MFLLSALFIITVSAIQGEVVKKLGDKCDRTSSENFPSLEPTKYLYCALNGTLQLYSCPSGKVYSAVAKGCETPANKTGPVGSKANATAINDDFTFFQPGICAQGTAYSMPGTSSPMSCLPQLGSVSCPQNYNCQFSSTSQQYYCCPSSSGCPANSQPFTNSAGSQICNMFDPNSCPQSYRCSQSTINPSQSICCSTTGTITSNSATCPNGSPPFNIGGTVQSCSLQVPCPSGLSCTTVLSGSSSQNICCPQSVIANNNVCPSGASALLSSNGQPTACSPGQFCGNGYTCQYYASSNSYYCCSNPSTSQTNGCPTGFTAEMQNGAVKFCSPSAPNCALGYSCQFSSVNSNYQCCMNSNSVQDGCPSGQSLHPLSTTSLLPLCPNSCPGPYSCVWSAVKQQQLCCGTANSAQSSCPNNGVAFIFPGSNLPMSCALGFPNCPAGYTCQQATNGQSICCSNSGQNTGGCPAGQTAVLNSGNPQQCGFGKPECPANSFCSQSLTSGIQICCSSGSINPCQHGYLHVNGVCRRLQCSLVD